MKTHPRKRPRTNRRKPVGKEVFEPEELTQVCCFQCFKFSMVDVDEQYDPPMVPTSVPLPPGAPDWVNEELVRDTIKTWQPFCRQPLAPDAAVALLINFGELLGTALEEE